MFPSAPGLVTVFPLTFEPFRYALDYALTFNWFYSHFPVDILYSSSISRYSSRRGKGLIP